MAQRWMIFSAKKFCNCNFYKNASDSKTLHITIIKLWIQFVNGFWAKIQCFTPYFDKYLEKTILDMIGSKIIFPMHIFKRWSLFSGYLCSKLSSKTETILDILTILKIPTCHLQNIFYLALLSTFPFTWTTRLTIKLLLQNCWQQR